MKRTFLPIGVEDRNRYKGHQDQTPHHTTDRNVLGMWSLGRLSLLRLRELRVRLRRCVRRRHCRGRRSSLRLRLR